MFKIRASAASKIMGGSVGLTETQKKDLDLLQNKEKLTEKQEIKLKELIHKRNNPVLPQGAKTYCKDWIKSKVFNRSKNYQNKYTDKGHIMEDEGIDFIADHLKYGMLFKNEDDFEDLHMRGTPDVILKHHIIDVKNSWSWETFPLLEEDVPNDDYYWQAQVYMNLCNKDSYKLIYVLLNTPMHLIEREAYFWAKNNGFEDLTEDILQRFIDDMTYDDISKHHRIKVFEIKRNDEDIKNLIQRVEMCRDFINQINYNNIKGDK